jgi:hypothetical protein
VKVKCFGCDALIEAADSDAVAEAFVVHGQVSHTWSYPEEAIRNYARNYADATERLTGGTERMSEIAAITVHPVTNDRMTPSPATPIGPRAIASNPMYRRRPSNLSAHGVRHGQPWPSDSGAARPSGISRTSTPDPLGGSTPHYAQITDSTDMPIPTDPSRHP